MYSEQLLDHFKNPRNAGALEPPAVTVDVENPACGDMLRLSAEIRDGVVERVRFLARGCTASIAAGSVLSVWLEGRSVEEIGAAGSAGIAAAIEDEIGELPAASKHAAVLAADGAAALVKRLSS